MNINLHSILSDSQPKTPIDDAISKSLCEMTIPSEWAHDCKESLAIAIIQNSNLGVKLIGADRWGTFNSILESARIKYKELAGTSREQQQLVNAIWSL